MDRTAVIERMDALVSIAGARMRSAAHQVEAQYAELLWMTQEEAEEFLRLRLSLPTPGQERREAIARLLARHPRMRAPLQES